MITLANFFFPRIRYQKIHQRKWIPQKHKQYLAYRACLDPSWIYPKVNCLLIVCIAGILAYHQPSAESWKWEFIVFCNVEYDNLCLNHVSSKSNGFHYVRIKKQLNILYNSTTELELPESVAFAAPGGLSSLTSAGDGVKLRKDFPESWIWDSLDETKGLVLCLDWFQYSDCLNLRIGVDFF